MSPNRGGDGGRGSPKRARVPFPDAVGAKKKSSTPSTPGRSADNGEADKVKNGIHLCSMSADKE